MKKIALIGGLLALAILGVIAVAYIRKSAVPLDIPSNDTLSVVSSEPSSATVAVMSETPTEIIPTAEASIEDTLIERLVPQIVAVLVPNELGGIGEPMVKEIRVCRPQIDKGCNLEEELLGISVASRYKTTLQSSMTSVQTTVPVTSILSYDGQTLSMDTLGPAVYLTLEPGTNREEITKCTLIASSQWQGCTRGLQFYGTSETASTTLQKAHNAGTIVIMSNVHYIYENLVDKDASENVGGEKTFTSGTVFFTNSDYGIRASTTAGALQWSINGFTDSYNFTSSSISTLTASSTRAIGVTASEIHVNASATSSLNFEGESGRLVVRASSTTGLATDAQGMYLVIPTTSSLKFDGNRLNLWVSSTNAIVQDTNGLYLNVPATSSLKIDGSRLNLWVSPTGAIAQDTTGISLNVSATSSVKIDGNRLVLWASSTRGFAQDTNGLYINVSSTLIFQNSLLAVNGSKTGLANLIVVGDESGVIDNSWFPTGLTGNVSADALHFHSNNEKIFATTTNITASQNEGTRRERAIMVTTTIPGGTLSVSNTVHALIHIGDLKLQTDAGGTVDGIRFRMNYGDSLVADTGEVSIFGAGDAQGPAQIEAWLYASTTSAQEGVIKYDFGSTTSGSATSTRALGFGTSAIDSSVNQDLVITVDFQCVNCSGTYQLETRDSFVEVIK